MAEQTLSYERYLGGLPVERREAIERVWQAVRENMPRGYTEKITPKYLTFMADDEWYIALANQKNYISLHLCSLYFFPELKAKLDNSGKKVKCGNSCINFKRVEDLPLEAIGEIIRAYDAEAYKNHLQQTRDKARAERKSAKKASKGKSRS
jgi:hypothetical protein